MLFIAALAAISVTYRCHFDVTEYFHTNTVPGWR